MKKLFFLFSLVGILLFHSSFKRDKNITWNEQPFVLSGKVLNADQYPQHKVIELIFYDILDLGNEKRTTATLDDSARFRIEVPVRYLQDFYLNYGRLTTLIAVPGKELDIEIDSRIWDEKIKGGMVYVAGGSAASTNRNVLRYFDELPSGKYSFMNAQDAINEKSPLEYVAYVSAREKEYAAFTTRFNKKYKTDEPFRTWVNDYLKYDAWNDLLRYLWEKPHNASLEIDDFEVPTEYLSFLEEKYDQDDCSLLSSTHIDFLHEYYMLVQRRPKAKRQEALEAFRKDGIPVGARILRSMIVGQTSGFTQNILLFRFYQMALKGKQLAEFEAIYQPADMTMLFFSTALAKEHQSLKDYLLGQEKVKVPLKELDSRIIQGLIDSLQHAYRGKVVYVDFWAPWCGPCMEEMPASKVLQQYFEGKDVVFLFLANRCKADAWKATIANEKLGGVHWKITDDQLKILSSELGISGIPHYTLIDRNGNIVDKDAPRPSEKERITKTIEQLFDK